MEMQHDCHEQTIRSRCLLESKRRRDLSEKGRPITSHCGLDGLLCVEVGPAAVLYRVWQQAVCRFAMALAKIIATPDGIHPVCPRPAGDVIRQSGHCDDEPESARQALVKKSMTAAL